jgi:hypothetical protein
MGVRAHPRRARPAAPRDLTGVRSLRARPPTFQRALNAAPALPQRAGPPARSQRCDHPAGPRSVQEGVERADNQPRDAAGRRDRL